MTATPDGNARLVRLSREEFRARLPEALRLYVNAMRYPSSTIEQRSPMWLTHALRDGWRCVAALDSDDTLLGIAYGYHGQPGQWWHDQVARGLAGTIHEQDGRRRLSDCFELTEIHVRPQSQAAGLGEQLIRTLLADLPEHHVLLSTPEGDTRAWRLYRRLGFVDVLRNYRFVGDHRPFAVLGRTLPLDAGRCGGQYAPARHTR